MRRLPFTSAASSTAAAARRVAVLIGTMPRGRGDRAQDPCAPRPGMRGAAALTTAWCRCSRSGPRQTSPRRLPPGGAAYRARRRRTTHGPRPSCASVSCRRRTTVARSHPRPRAPTPTPTLRSDAGETRYSCTSIRGQGGDRRARRQECASRAALAARVATPTRAAAPSPREPAHHSARPARARRGAACRRCARPQRAACAAGVAAARWSSAALTS